MVFSIINFDTDIHHQVLMNTQCIDYTESVVIFRCMNIQKTKGRATIYKHIKTKELLYTDIQIIEQKTIRPR